MTGRQHRPADVGDELEEIAVSIAAGVITNARDLDRHAVAGTLDTVDLQLAKAIIVILAHAVPDSIPVSSLRARPRRPAVASWTQATVDQVDCGSAMAAVGHIERREQLDDKCYEAYRRWTTPRRSA